MKCVYCNQKMNKVTTSTNTKWGDYEITISGLPAYECPECGEKIFTSQTIDIIQGLAAGIADSTQQDKPNNLNVTETADMLRVSKQTIYNMLRDGRLSAKKVGREWRFDPDEVARTLPRPANQFDAVARSDMLTEKDATIVENIIYKK